MTFVGKKSFNERNKISSEDKNRYKHHISHRTEGRGGERREVEGSNLDMVIFW